MHTKEESITMVDFGIVTALPIERNAIVRHLQNIQKIQSEELDIRTYYLGQVFTTHGFYNLVVVMTLNTGTVDAVATTNDLIRHFNPRYIAMIGIAGGFPRDGLSPGDIVVADQVIEYEYAKELNDYSEIRPRVYKCDALLLSRIKDFSNWTGNIELLRPSYILQDKPKLLVGPIASGNKVIASEQAREKIRKAHSRVLAVEMEGGGVALAAWQLPKPKGVIVIRGISDLADAAKNDNWQPYAAASAATFFMDFLRNEPISFAARVEHNRAFDISFDNDNLERFYKE